MGTAHTHTPRARPYPPPIESLVPLCCNAAWHGATHNIATQQDERCNVAMHNDAMQHIAMQHSQLGHCAMQQDAIGISYWLCNDDEYIYWSQTGTTCFFVRWSVFLICKHKQGNTSCKLNTLFNLIARANTASAFAQWAALQWDTFAIWTMLSLGAKQTLSLIVTQTRGIAWLKKY